MCRHGVSLGRPGATDLPQWGLEQGAWGEAGAEGCLLGEAVVRRGVGQCRRGLDADVLRWVREAECEGGGPAWRERQVFKPRHFFFIFIFYFLIIFIFILFSFL